MGLLANFMGVDDATLGSLRGLDDDALVERIEELEEAGGPVYPMDKMWDILHFVLTGTSAMMPIEGDALSEAVVGVHVFDVEDFVGVTEAAELPRVLAAMEGLDVAALRSRLSFPALRDKGLYPRLSESTPDAENALWVQVAKEFEGLRSFYREAVDAHLNVLVSVY